jgi:hypothetical protein
MDQTTSDQIESHIRSTRENLRSNLEELEGRVKSALDWREQFRRNPALGMGLAAGAGFLLARLSARPRRRATGERSAPALLERPGHLHHVWNTVHSTLIGIAVARATDLLTELLHGRRDEPLRESDYESVDVQGAGNGGNVTKASHPTL